MLRHAASSLAGSLSRLAVTEAGALQSHTVSTACLRPSAAATLVSLRSFSSNVLLEGSGTLDRQAGSSAARDAAATRSFATASSPAEAQANSTAATAAVEQQQQQQQQAVAESLEEIRARVFGYHIGA